MPRPKWLWLLLAAGNAAVWIVQSNVVKLVARDHQTLLGRYSFAHFLWNVALLVATAIVLYIARAPDRRDRRLRALRIVAIFASTILTLVIADIPLRIKYPPTYKLDRPAYRRPPGVRWHVSVDDVPDARRSYAVVRPGYKHVDCVFMIDANGYRNRSIQARYDIVALGDSFTEGSRVSDDQAWPAVLARLTGLSVYNLGMSGYSPQHYVASLKTEGLRLSPRFVVCTLYEGNDFRSTETITGSHLRIKQIFRSSPIIQGTRHLLVRALGPIGADWDVKGLDILSWLPLGVPDGPAAKYYAFTPKDVIDLCIDADQFQQGRKWANVAECLAALHDACRDCGAELILVYIPAKPRVVLPLAADRLPAEQVRAFVAIDAKMKLPPPKAFLAELFARIDTRESIVAQWCRTHSIRFVSLTPAFREAARTGRQAYYTYDTHWTPIGHEIVAGVVQDCIHAPPRDL